MARLLLQIGLAGMLCVGGVFNSGCPSRPSVPTTVTIEYVNSTGADVLVDLLASNDPNITQDQLLAGGTMFRDTVAAGGSPLQFDLSCADAKAIIIDRAVMVITNGPEIGSTILYQDQDYFCGEIVSFEFTTNADQTELAVNVAYFPQ